MSLMHRGTRTPSARTAISSVAVAGVSAALALTAAVTPAAGTPTSQRHTAAHQHVTAHHTRHAHHIVVNGLTKSHHGRTITVFATTEKLGHKTRHNKKVTITFARGVRTHLDHVRHGNKIHLNARGVGDLHHFVVRHKESENTDSAPATLIFGTITEENGSMLLVSESNRDNGDDQRGDDQGDHSGPDGDGMDHVHGDRGGDGHNVVVDTSGAKTVELDGAEVAPAIGDEVAILGEVTDNTVLADAVYGFSNPQSFLRGQVTAINGTSVTLNGEDDGEDDGTDDSDVSDDGGNGVTVNLADAPLFVNGSTGSTLDQLTVGDKLLVIGDFSLTDNSFAPSLAFAFNGHDDHPCGDNDQGDDHGGDGPGDRGSDG